MSREENKYQVTVFYTTPTGRAAHKSFKVLAGNEEQAGERATGKYRKGKKGKGYRITGRAIYRIR